MNTSSLQFRLVMVIVSVGIMVALVAGMFVWQMSANLSLREQDTINQTLRDTLQNRLDSKLDVGLTNAAALAVRPDIVTALMSGDPAFAKTTLAGVSENIKKETNYKGVRLHLIDAELNSLARSWTEKGVGDSNAARASRQQIKADQKPIVGFEAGKEGVWLRSVAAIHDPDQRFIGMLEFIQGVGSISRDFEKEGRRYVALVNPDLAPQGDSVGEWKLTVTKHYSDETQAFARSVDLATLFAQGVLNTPEWYVTALPLKDIGGKQLGWHVLAEPQARLQAKIQHAHQMGWLFLLLLLLSLLAMGAGVLVLVRKAMVKPTQGIAKRMKKLAEGDFTTQFHTERNDEIGLVSQSAQNMVQQTATTFAQVRHASQQLHVAADALSQQARQINQGAQDQSRNVSATAAAVEQISRSIEEVARSAALAQQESLATRQTVEEGVQVVSVTCQDMIGIAQSVQSAAKKVTHLNASTDRVENIVQTIKDIADQTNLLALNAAIEAARAGETGRGFAVVADEVRKLAEKTIIATEEISSMVLEIQGSTDSVVKEMEQSLGQVDRGQQSAKQASTALQDIRQRVERVTQEMQQISLATQEQARATHSLGESMTGIAEVAAYNAQAVGQTQTVAEEINQQANQMEQQLAGLRLP